MSSGLAGLSDALNSLAGMVNDIANSFIEAFHTTPDVRMGKRVYVAAGEVGAFHGHVCEYRSPVTATVARESDGVLIHVRRDQLREVYTDE